MDKYLAGLATEEINESTVCIDECSTAEILRLINEQDCTVAYAVKQELPHIEAAVDIIYEGLKNNGRLIYVGAGTSGRLGVLDASECPPTYGISSTMVQGFIAGGDYALRNAAEGCEDDAEAGAELMRGLNIGKNDIVVGITASGSAAYVIEAANVAKALGAKTIAIVNNEGTRLGEVCDICIAPKVGPEVVMGSTRMKSGTAQKLVLNMLSTSVMIKLGKVYNNLMVDLRATNKKLLDRSIRIVCAATGASEAQAERALNEADMQAKTAIFMIMTSLDANEAVKILEECSGFIKPALRKALCNA